MSRQLLLRTLALFLAAFALYALTAQRGLGWGDSGEFQYRILTLGAEGVLKGCDSFATAHPLYVALAKLFCSTPFHVTLLTAFFGALAVALFYLLSRNFILAGLFALSHGLWWLSTVSEVYTMSLCFFAAELLALRRFRETGSAGALCALAALNGLHLELHNLALLSIPVYLWVVLTRAGIWRVRIEWVHFREMHADRTPLCSAIGAFHGNAPTCAPDPRDDERRLRPLLLAALLWVLAASFWIWSFFTLGPANVLFGNYGAQVLTLKPILPQAIPLNLALGALSLAVPALLMVGEGVRRETGDLSGDGRREARDWVLISLFVIHFGFWSTYFIVSQYTFILPSALLAYLLASSRGRVSVVPSVGAFPRNAQVSPVGAFPRNAQVGGKIPTAGVVQARLSGSSRNCPHGSSAPECDDSAASVGAFPRNAQVSSVGAFPRNAPVFRGRISVKCAIPLFAIQLLLPVALWGVLAAIGFPSAYCAEHPGRDNAAYFALPWHMTDDSASHAAALRRTPWTGYP